jgi:hypothetical protein
MRHAKSKTPSPARRGVEGAAPSAANERARQRPRKPLDLERIDAFRKTLPFDPVHSVTLIRAMRDARH